MKIGYARVSSYGQSLDMQLESLKTSGCEKIFHEKISGAKEDRKEFTAMLEFAREGDQIVVTRLDRLSRSLFELQKCFKTLEDNKIDIGGCLSNRSTLLPPLLPPLEGFCLT